MSFTAAELVRGAPRTQSGPWTTPLDRREPRERASEPARGTSEPAGEGHRAHGSSAHRPGLLRRYLDWVWPSHPRTLGESVLQLGPGAVHLLRLTGGAMCAYVLTRMLSAHLGPAPIDLTGPLTALLVLQASTYSTLQMGAVRVGAVLTGISVALVVSTWAGLTWWSLGLAIGSALVLAKLLGLGRQTLEAPISAMLILATSWHPIAVETRLFNTLIGAGVGITLALVLPPGLPVRSAAHAVRRFASAQARLLDKVAEQLTTPRPEEPNPGTHDPGTSSTAGRPSTAAQLETAQNGWEQVMDLRDRSRSLVGDLRDARRFNPRALGTADLDPVLTSAVRDLEATASALHTLLPAIARRSHDDRASEDERQTMAVLLGQLAAGMRAFGDLVHAEVHGEETRITEQLERTLDELGEARSLLTELLLVGEGSGHWLLDGVILTSVERVLDLLDAGRRDAARANWREEQAGKLLTRGTVLNRETLDELRRGKVRLRRTRVSR